MKFLFITIIMYWLFSLSTAAKYDGFTYVLQLARGKYYVGSTNNLQRRLSEHFSGYGAKWTQKYQPQKLVYTKKGKGHENALTKDTMRKYGIDNVRGGSWSQRILSKKQKQSLAKKIR